VKANKVRAIRTFQPSLDNVVVDWIVGSEKRTPGGLLLPDQAEDWATPQGWVVAVGPDVKHLKVGDRVLVYMNQMCRMVRHGNRKKVYVYKEADILGTVDERYYDEIHDDADGKLPEAGIR
jgi:co-chaperonin GroES (HSP10)